VPNHITACSLAHLGPRFGATLSSCEVSAMPGTSMDNWVRPAVILVATDLCDLDRLMPFALEEASDSGARLILLHVLAPSGEIEAGPGEMPLYDSIKALEYATRVLEPCCHTAHQRKIACDLLIREGNITQQIVAASRQFHADRILISSRSRSKIGKLLLGSVVEQVLRSVNLPVMTVGPEAHLPVENSDRQRIVLHATTLREASRPSAALACRIAANQGARLLLLYVLPPEDEMKQRCLTTGPESAALRELRLLAAETGANCCVGIEPLVVHGNPTIEILAEASEQAASLIVLGASRHSSYDKLTRDHVIYHILAHARCPVLTLRDPEHLSAEASSERLATYS
jgi:nucleotide-binding universal stress UspA family protein